APIHVIGVVDRTQECAEARVLIERRFEIVGRRQCPFGAQTPGVLVPLIRNEAAAPGRLLRERPSAEHTRSQPGRRRTKINGRRDAEIETLHAIEAVKPRDVVWKEIESRRAVRLPDVRSEVLKVIRVHGAARLPKAELPIVKATNAV